MKMPNIAHFVLLTEHLNARIIISLGYNEFYNNCDYYYCEFGFQRKKSESRF